MKKIIITGSSGFIASQFIFDYGAGYEIRGIDVRDKPNASMPYGHMTSEFNHSCVGQLMKMFQPDAVVHLAASTNVGDSVKDPVSYYTNNVAKPLSLIDMIREECPTTKLIFASSAGVYGDPRITCEETIPCMPINPYGRQKLFMENYIIDCAHYCHTNYVHLRFFNVCGADPMLRCGPADNDFHLIPVVVRRLMQDKPISVNGIGYQTHDGSCERDYVHVKDVAAAIHRAIETDEKGVYNIATGIKTSNRDVITKIADAMGKQVVWDCQPKREGDPSVLVADISRAKKYLGWEPKLTIDNAIADTIKWYAK